MAPQDHSRRQLRDGHFVLHGLDPNSEVEIPAFSSTGSPKLRDGSVLGTVVGECECHRPT